MHHWGIDVEKQHHLSRQAIPKSSPGSWMHSEDYPKEMLTYQMDGLVYFRLIIEPTGDVSSCAVQESVMPKQYNDLTCKLIIRRAKFEPALDAEGQPIKSYWSSSVRWMIAR